MLESIWLLAKLLASIPLRNCWWARFKDRILPQIDDIAIWLDADTIVQKDVKELQTRLRASGRTIGFVYRSTKMYPDFLTGKCTPILDVPWKKLKNLNAYNTGARARADKEDLASFLLP